MSPRLRVYAIVAACAVAAAGLTVGVTLATRTTVPKPRTARSGSPPLVLDLGVRTDPEAVALRRASGLYDTGKTRDAGRIFGRYRSPEAEVGAALAGWPGGFSQLAGLARAYPRSSLVQLNYGVALYWRGDGAGAKAAWRTARSAQPDTPYAIRAGDLLHPNFPRGLPNFVPSFRPPAGLARLSPPRQLALPPASGGVRRRPRQAPLRCRPPAAGAPGLGPARIRGGGPPGARRSRAEGRAAVARFDKADPALAFSRLGPLARRYPNSQSVRFHLGLCLLWLGSLDQARQELRLARAAGPKTPLGVESSQFPLPAGRNQDPLRRRWVIRPMASIRRVCNGAAFVWRGV